MSMGDIVVLAIVAAAIVLAVIRISKKKTTCGCGCSECTAGCDRKQILRSEKKFDRDQKL